MPVPRRVREQPFAAVLAEQRMQPVDPGRCWANRSQESGKPGAIQSCVAAVSCHDRRPYIEVKSAILLPGHRYSLCGHRFTTPHPLH